MIPNPEGLLSQTKFVQKAIVMHPQQALMLVLQRPYTNAAEGQGVWDLPGGKVDHGEHNLNAIQREIQEETGLFVVAMRVQWVQTAVNDYTGVYYIFAGYHCRALSAAVTLSHEHHAYQWLPPTEFMRLPSTPFLQNLVREAFKL
jgi:8-oxo-dGTP diphosphatase